jgi:flagellar hook assembly protein FlgD
MGTATEIAYSVAVPGHVTLAIFDVGGRLVRTLVDRSESAGEHSVVWNRRNDSGEIVRRGVYVCRFQAPSFRMSRKIVVQ